MCSIDQHGGSASPGTPRPKAASGLSPARFPQPDRVERVQAALGGVSSGLRLIEVATATGMSVTEASTALYALEQKGRVRFAGGVWNPVHPERTTP